MASETKTPQAQDDYQPNLITLEEQDDNEIPFAVIAARGHTVVQSPAVVGQ